MSIQDQLDSISNVPGSILYRATDGWTYVAPTIVDALLAQNGDAAPPFWLDRSNIAITELHGDVIAGPGAGDQEATLSSTGVIPGTYTNADLEIDAAGRILAASDGTAGASPGGSAESIQVNDGAGDLAGIGPLTNGQLIIGSTGARAVAAALTAGSNIQITPGAGAITISSAGAAGGNGLLTPIMGPIPTISSTGFNTWKNQGTATVRDGLTGLCVYGPVNSNQIEGRTRTPPTVPYSTDFVIDVMSYNNNNGFGGVIGWTDGTKLTLFMVAHGNTGAFIYVLDYATTGNGGGAANLLFQMPNQGLLPFTGSLKETSTQVQFCVCPAGDYGNAIPVYTRTKSGGYLANYNLQFFGINVGNQAVAATLMSLVDR